MNKHRFDNVWDALEDTPYEAENMKVRATLMDAVQEFVRTLDGTQAEAASQLGITQPRLNDLLHGKINKFSLDALVKMLAHAGKHVSIRIQDAA